jgi:hypothetical protein
MATTQYTRKQIKDRIDSQLADNSSQAITAADVRDVLKGYMTSSMYAPVMIYAGIVKQDEGSGGTYPDRPYSIKELYFNPDFFQKQEESNPGSSLNIYQITNTAVAATDGTYIITNITGGSGSELNVKVIVSSGIITSMAILTQGGGYKVNDIMQFTLGQSTVDIKYNGAIRNAGTKFFNMTVNSDNTKGTHTENNTIISASYEGPSNLGGSATMDIENRISADNTIIIRLDFGSIDFDENYQHIQLYRVAGI